VQNNLLAYFCNKIPYILGLVYGAHNYKSIGGNEINIYRRVEDGRIIQERYVEFVTNK
jgi:hypothetical protein